MAYARLLRAVYHRARLDLIEATITGNTGRLIEVTKFYRNDPYIFTPEEGDDAIETILHDVNEADGFIFGSPVYYAAASGQITSFLDRNC